VEFDDLPHTDDVAADLALLVHSLERFPALRLSGLGALPSVRDWRPPEHSKQHSEQERRALAVAHIVTNAIKSYPHEDEKRALGRLFTFGHLERPVQERQNDAAKAVGLKSGDSFRKSREPVILRALADNIYRHELLHGLSRYDSILDSARMGATWWRTVEFDWAVTITAERPNEQLWQFCHILRCMTSVSLPMFTIILPWTGTGPHKPETVKALSGPSPEDSEAEFAHTLLRIRPVLPGVSHRREMAYIWDLGAPLTEGEEIELNFTQEFVDTADTFIPAIECYTRADTIVRSFRLRANLPPGMAVGGRGEMTPRPLWQRDDGSMARGPTARPVERVPIDTPDSAGYYIYEPNLILPNHNYTLSWGE
jgi:hypothetical protein